MCGESPGSAGIDPPPPSPSPHTPFLYRSATEEADATYHVCVDAVSFHQSMRVNLVYIQCTFAPLG